MGIFSNRNSRFTLCKAPLQSGLENKPFEFLKTKIAITSLASISPLGNHPEAIWRNYLSDATLISTKEFNGKNQFVATIPTEIRNQIEVIRNEEIK